jgi:ABC-type multidrug transport system ATPase subunit
MQLTANNLRAAGLFDTYLDGVSFSFPLPDKTAVYGSRGSGKTVLLLILGGFLKPRHGSLFYDKINVFRHLKKIRGRNSLGEIAKINPLVEEFTPRENLQYCLKLAKRKNAQTAANQALEDFGIKKYADTPLHQASPLARSVTSLACALAVGPEIIFLAEPTETLTDREAERFWQIANQNLGGAKLIFTTRNKAEAEKQAQKIIYLERGRLAVPA